jgi:hypothetical protein
MLLPQIAITIFILILTMQIQNILNRYFLLTSLKSKFILLFGEGNYKDSKS